MTDVHTKAIRSYNMSRILAKNTKPEIIVRKLIHGLGFRFRLHRRYLPGIPDLVFPSQKKIIFVHGCFWHVHSCKYGRVIPKTNADFWVKKRLGNKKRDRKNIAELKRLGWDVLVIWECQTKKPETIINKVITFMKN